MYPLQMLQMHPATFTMWQAAIGQGTGSKSVASYAHVHMPLQCRPPEGTWICLVIWECYRPTILPRRKKKHGHGHVSATRAGPNLGKRRQLVWMTSRQAIQHPYLSLPWCTGTLANLLSPRVSINVSHDAPRFMPPHIAYSMIPLPPVVENNPLTDLSLAHTSCFQSCSASLQ